MILHSMKENYKIISMLGLLGFAFIDENSRIIFLDVAKMSIAAYLGYLVPNAR